MGQGVYTATMQAVCEETGLPAGIMTVKWDKELGEKCGETWASRGTTLSCAARRSARRRQPAIAEILERHAYVRWSELVGREYYGECVYNFTTRPGTPEAVTNPTTHLTFSYATQVVLLDEDGTRRAGGGGERRRPRDQPAAVRRTDGGRRAHGSRLRAVGGFPVGRRAA